MHEVYYYAIITGGSLLIGAIIGSIYKIKQNFIAAIMAFGSGLLICTLTFGLMEEAFALGGFDAVIVGFIVGGLAFVGGDYLLHYFGGRRHRRIQLFKPLKETNGKVIVLGSVLDNIPESIALGLVIANSQPSVVVLAVAVMIANFAESISSIRGLIKEKFSKKSIFLMWFFIAFATACIVIFSFHFLSGLSNNNIAIVESFAAGAILAMLADSMIPEAFEDGGFGIALLTLFGFLTAFILNRL